MGWTAHELPNPDWKLFTRGGTCGVFVKRDGRDEEIEIPSDLLRMLVADDLRSQRITELEDMTDDDVLGLTPFV